MCACAFFHEPRACPLIFSLSSTSPTFVKAKEVASEPAACLLNHKGCASEAWQVGMPCRHPCPRTPKCCLSTGACSCSCCQNSEGTLEVVFCLIWVFVFNCAPQLPSLGMSDYMKKSVQYPEAWYCVLQGEAVSSVSESDRDLLCMHTRNRFRSIQISHSHCHIDLGRGSAAPGIEGKCCFEDFPVLAALFAPFRSAGTENGDMNDQQAKLLICKYGKIWRSLMFCRIN